jgi:hypothetical protein
MNLNIIREMLDALLLFFFLYLSNYDVTFKIIIKFEIVIINYNWENTKRLRTYHAFSYYSPV